LLLAAAELPSGRSSLWVATGDIDLIVYPLGAKPTEQLRAIAHQAAHIFLGHQAAAGDIAPQVFPHLSPNFVAAKIVVSRFSEADELAADSFATRLVASTGLSETTTRPDRAQHRTQGDPA
jgi:hypothetical protein